MKYFLIAGEASGDLHASNLMKELLRNDPEAEFRYMGGDLMMEVAEGRIMHYKETSYMFLDVIFHLRKIFRNLRLVRDEIESWKPDLVIPVDYPGFNLRIARHASDLGLIVFYFITPKVWAWKQRRVHSLKKYARRLFVILPFEVPWFAERGVEVEYFGNPLVDAAESFRRNFRGPEDFRKTHGLDERPLIALLAGSRQKEIEGMLPAMTRVAAGYPDYQFVVAGAPSIEADFYAGFLEGSDVKIVHGNTYGLLSTAWAAMVTSGTATLETAIFRVPQVVLYRTSSLAYTIAKRIVDVPFISLVNLISGKGLVKEVIQKDLYLESEKELSRILSEPGAREEMLAGYDELITQLGEEGVSARIARRMVEFLTEGGKK